MNISMTMPRWAMVFTRVVVRLGEAVALIAFVASHAHGAGSTLPERQATLCAAVGRAASCTIVNEPGRKLRGTLTVIIGDTTAEPGAEPVWPDIHVSGYTFTPRRGPTIATLSLINDGDATALLWYLREPPCLEVACVEKREADPTYSGPTETALQDEPTVLAKLAWQIPDPHVATAFRTLAGATGVPYVAWVRPTKSCLWDAHLTALPTTRSADILILFAQ